MRSTFFRSSASICIIIGLFVGSPFAQQSPRELFERARMLDESIQDLPEAIKLYAQVAAQSKDNRALAAKSQYSIGNLYERLGRRAEAERAYAKLVSQYPDQMDLAQRAKTKLAALASTRPREIIINKTGPSAHGLFLATFAIPPGLTISNPAIDTARRRLYLFTQRLRPLGKDAESSRAARRGLRQVYEPSTLVVIDLDSLSIVKTLPLPVFIGAAAFNPVTNKLYGTATADGYLTVIDSITFSLHLIPLAGFPHCVAINPETNLIYVSSDGFAGLDKMFVIDGSTNAVVTRCELDGSAGLVIVNTTTNRVYASAADPAKTRVFDGADNSALEDLPSLWVIGVDSRDSRLYALSTVLGGATSNGVRVLDAATHRQLTTLVTGSGSVPLGLALDQEVKRVYVALHTENQIAVIDSTTGVEADRFPIYGPMATVLDQRTGRLFISHSAANSSWMLSVLDPRFVSEVIPEEFFDDFESETLDPAWQKTRARGDCSLSENRGYLRYRVAPRSAGTGNAVTMLVRKFRGDNWLLEVKASYSMGTTGGGRSLSLAVSFGTPTEARAAVINVQRQRGDWSGRSPGGTGVEASQRLVGGSLKDSAPNHTDSYVWRIRRNRRTITVDRSDDGINFTREAENVFGPQIDGVIQYLCISGDSFANDDAYGDFDYVRLTKERSEGKTQSQSRPSIRVR